jgi:hypothetical protein
MNLYETDNYTKYLKFRLSGAGAGRRGLKTRFAKAIQCDGAYVTRILEASAGLSPEQGMRANAFLGHTEDESDFFLTLIGLARAGTKELRGYYQKRLSQLRDQHYTLSKRVKDVESLPEITQATYYSLWLYAAVDVATSVPALQTTEALCEAFQLPLSTLGPILGFLRECGVVEQKENRWINTGRPIYLTSDSPHIRKHHLNWRLKAMQLIEQPKSANLHYSSVISLSAKDFERLKEQFIQTISSARELVKGSKDEVVAAYCIDCFTLSTP